MLADTCTTPTFTNPQDTLGKIKGGLYTPQPVHYYHSVTHVRPPSRVSPPTFSAKVLAQVFLSHVKVPQPWPFYQNDLRRNSYTVKFKVPTATQERSQRP